MPRRHRRHSRPELNSCPLIRICARPSAPHSPPRPANLHFHSCYGPIAVDLINPVIPAMKGICGLQHPIADRKLRQFAPPFRNPHPTPPARKLHARYVENAQSAPTSPAYFPRLLPTFSSVVPNHRVSPPALPAPAARPPSATHNPTPTTSRRIRSSPQPNLCSTGSISFALVSASHQPAL